MGILVKPAVRDLVANRANESDIFGINSLALSMKRAKIGSVAQVNEIVLS